MDFGQGGNEETNDVFPKGNEEISTLNTNTDNSTDVTNLDKFGLTNENKELVENEETNNDPSNNKEENVYEEGTILQINGEEYSIDDKGNILNSKGEIFKTSEERDSFLKDFEEGENLNMLNIEDIQNSIDIVITDENDNPVEFENSKDGIIEYFNAVLEVSKEEIREDAIKSLYETYPVLESFLNYYIANGNSYEGFGEIKDRSSIELDPNNINQQQDIIRIAWKEKGIKGDVENYIKYLESNDTLFDTAQSELESIQENDIAYRTKLAEEAKAIEENSIKEREKYWNKVKGIVDSKQLGNYKIPDTIIVNDNGKKHSYSNKDFFNYIYRVDKNGKTAYENDLGSENIDSRINRDLLQAFLMFSKGNYESLVDMAVKEKEVKRVILNSKNKPKTTFNKGNGNVKSGKLDLGIN